MSTHNRCGHGEIRYATLNIIHVFMEKICFHEEIRKKKSVLIG